MPNDAEYLSSLLQHCINDAEEGEAALVQCLTTPTHPYRRSDRLCSGADSATSGSGYRAPMRRMH